ncbi:MAG: PhoU domain-containing protein, partial [bacterium]
QSFQIKALTCYERIGDHAINIAKDLAGLKAQKGKFSEMALADIEVLATAVRNILELAEKAVTSQEYDDAIRIEPLEEVIDALTEELRSRHIQRMTRGDCDVYSGIQYDNILSNMERIADQCSDLGLAVMVLTRSSILGQEHQYIQDVHRDLGKNYQVLYRQEYDRYFGILEKNDRMNEGA